MAKDFTKSHEDDQGSVAVAESPKVAVPPAEKARICDPNERAPRGWKRYRIRGAVSDGNKPVKYVLARNDADAKAEYVKVHNLGPEMGTGPGVIQNKDGKLEPGLVALPNWKLIVTELPD